MTEAEDPSVHAGYMKDPFASLDARDLLAPIAQAQPELVRAVEEASRSAWLPVELNVRLVEEPCRVAGDERGLVTLAECVHAQFESPLWNTLVSGAVRLLGLDPGRLGRWMPRAYGLIFRDCGTWFVEKTGPTELRVALQGLPASLASHRLWLRSLAIGMRSLLLLCRVEGSADLLETKPHLRSARFGLTWKADG
jgi:hypothetical protein